MKNAKSVMTVSFAVLVMALSSVSFADSPIQKPALRVDWNRMIEETHQEKQKLHGGLEHAADESAPVAVEKTASASAKEKEKVIDFIDMEVGLGDTPGPVVDRRFDSVGEPRAVNVNATAPSSDEGQGS
ncbi:MAG: hypothetical protein AB7G93_15815 [Bdellovibrionales bacterium]